MKKKLRVIPKSETLFLLLRKDSRSKIVLCLECCCFFFQIIRLVNSRHSDSRTQTAEQCPCYFKENLS